MAKIRIAVPISEIPGQFASFTPSGGSLGFGTAIKYDVLELSDGMAIAEIKDQVDRFYGLNPQGKINIDMYDWSELEKK